MSEKNQDRQIHAMTKIEVVLGNNIRSGLSGVDLYWPNGRHFASLRNDSLTQWEDGKTSLETARSWMRKHLVDAFEAGYEDGKSFEAGFESHREDTVSAERHQEIGERRAMLWVMELLGFHPHGKEDDFRVATIKLKEELPRMIEADRRILFDDGAKSVRKQIEDYLSNRELRLDQAVEECAKIEEQMEAAKKKKEELKSEMATLIEVASMISEVDRE